jgi:hypothetical protein
MNLRCGPRIEITETARGMLLENSVQDAKNILSASQHCQQMVACLVSIQKPGYVGRWVGLTRHAGQV